MRFHHFATRVAVCSFLHVALLATTVMGAAEDPAEAEFDPGDFNAVRVENEYKLTVPSDQVEEVWAHFLKRYAADSPMWKELGGGDFTATFSDEDFIDRYFDNNDFELIGRAGSVRHRSRTVRDNPDAKKHGRQLVQFKLARPGDLETNRSEIKYPVEPNPGRDPLSTHPLVGLVSKKYREEFIKTGTDFGLDVMEMWNTITLNQRRRRVYISLAGTPYATITLDDVKSEKFGHNIAWTEIELELNEMLYTVIKPEERKAMEASQAKIKADVLTTFPRIIVDQTPKYNKAYNKFSAQFASLPLALRMNMPISRVVTTGSIVGGLCVVGGVVWLVSRRRASRVSREPAAVAASS